MSDLNIPEEAEEFRFYCSDQCGRMGFEVEGVAVVVAAELERLLAEAFPDGEDSDHHYACEQLLDSVRERAAELRSGVSGTGDQQ